VDFMNRGEKGKGRERDRNKSMDVERAVEEVGREGSDGDVEEAGGLYD